MEQKTQEFPQPLLYSLDEAGVLLSMSVSSLRRLIKEGKLKTFHPSPGAVRVSRAELESFVYGNRVIETRDTSAKTAPGCHSDRRTL